MDFELTEELAAVRELAREFAEKEIAPKAAEDDREHRFRRDLVEKMAELGFFGCTLPEDCGGNNLGFLALVIISEEIARVHSAIRVFINMQAGPATTIADFGSAEQKQWVTTAAAEVSAKEPAKAFDLERAAATKLKSIGVKIVTDVDKSGFTAIADPYLDKLAKELGPHADKIKTLIRAIN